MIPLRTTITSQRFPWVNYSLIVANVAAFAYAIPFSDHFSSIIRTYGWVPASFFHALRDGQLPVLTPLFVSMFLHGNWLHLFGNLLYLNIFGGNVEDRLGRCRYLCFYLLGGISAVLVQTYASPLSSTPMIGASGAIAAVTGAYFVFYPTARVFTLVPLVFSFRVVRVPALFYLLLWLLLQIISGVYASSPDGQEVAGVAWWAHVGGFVAGLTLGPIFLYTRRRSRRLRLHPPLVWSPRSVLR
jgi:membrane associated rhomboid family serine protease